MASYKTGRYITGPLGKYSRPCIIRCEYLTVQQETRSLLHDLCLDIYEGEAVAVLGDDTAGKSALLACLQGMLRPTRGHLQVLGADIPPIPPDIRLQIGVLPRYLHLPEEATVLDALTYYASLYELYLNSPQLENYIQTYHLHLDSVVSQLSPLEQGLLSFALTLLHDPSLVLLDEPLDGLTEDDREIIWHYLRQIRREGRTQVTTFTPPIAESLLNEYDVVITLEEGRILLR
jgi:ABC-2 type transport system ATP-binding protein